MAAESLGQAFYTRETAVEFHDLVYAALVTYARDIDDFRTQFKTNLSKKFESAADVQLSDGLKDAFNGLEWSTRLLLCILTSSAFKVHVKIITNGGALLRYLKPTFENRDLYRSYANLILGLQSTKSITTSITGGAERDPEMDAPVPAEGASLDEFKRWSRVFVSHFIAKRTLEIQCRKENFSLGNASLLNAERSRFRVPGWEFFRGVIMRAINAGTPVVGNIDPTTISNRLVNKIKSFKKPNKDDKESIAAWITVKFFQKLVMEDAETTREPYYLGTHCEALLCSLGEYHNEADISPHDGALAQTCKKMNTDLISVSKLCCPVCWEFFCTLKNVKDKGIIIHGCHSTIYPVVLPKWLPEEIEKPMIETFQNHLCNELSALVPGEVKPNHAKVHQKNQSQTNVCESSSAVSGVETRVTQSRYTMLREKLEEKSRLPESSA